METTVEVMRGVLPQVLDGRLIQLYNEGDEATRAEVQVALDLLTGTMDRACSAVPCLAGVRRTSVQVGSMDAAWFTPDELHDCTASAPVILYFHGGAYLTCSVNTHARLVSALARSSLARVLAVNYRLSPAAKFDQILEDAMEALEFLLASGVPAERIVVAGDSAGGHLALALCATLVQRRPHLVPGGCLALSPWIDTHMSLLDPSDSWQQNREMDYLGFFVGSSPHALIFGDGACHPLDNLLKLPDHVLAKLPPTLIQVGSNECLLSEITTFAQRMGPRATLDVYGGMVHVFQMFLDLEERAADALAALGAHVRSCTADTRDTKVLSSSTNATK